MLADDELLADGRDADDPAESYDLTKRSFDRGVVTQLDVAQARTSVETARANRAAYVQQSAQDENALNLLVGSRPPTGAGSGPIAQDRGFAPACRPGCRPTCCSAGPTSSRPNTS